MKCLAFVYLSGNYEISKGPSDRKLVSEIIFCRLHLQPLIFCLHMIYMSNILISNLSPYILCFSVGDENGEWVKIFHPKVIQDLLGIENVG